ncbi:type II secretion system protein [PVC group bacterium]|nr:type II secretion system protein [PVC group bacterium]
MDKRLNHKGLTLLELLIAIAIAGMLTGVTLYMLQASLDAYTYSQQEILLEKAIDDCLEEIIQGGFDNLGVKDSLEILDLGETFIRFVPLWTDETHDPSFVHQSSRTAAQKPFILNRPYKPGSFTPIAEILEEVSESGKEKWSQIPVTFVPGEKERARELNDKVYLTQAVRAGDRIRFIFHPDAEHFPDCAMTLSWKDDSLSRTYRGLTQSIPGRLPSGGKISQCHFQYFNNMNQELSPLKVNIPNISAVKVSVTASIGHAQEKDIQTQKTGTAFVHMRNTRSSGSGLLIAEGTRIRIPDSEHIRVFSLANIRTFESGDRIVLEAKPETGRMWRIQVTLGYDHDAPVITKYMVEYPPGHVVLSENVNLTTDIPLNFLSLGPDGRYDYDFDKGKENVVFLRGLVDLEVVKMEPRGAALFVRP